MSVMAETLFQFFLWYTAIGASARSKSTAGRIKVLLRELSTFAILAPLTAMQAILGQLIFPSQL